MGNVVTRDFPLVARYVPLDKENTGIVGYITTLRAFEHAGGAYFEFAESFSSTRLAKT